MAIQQMLFGAGSGKESKTLADFFGVNKNSSTDVTMEYLSRGWTFGWSEPSQANSWASMPSNSNAGMFVSGIWKTDEDNYGMWAEGNPYGMDEPAGIGAEYVSESGNWHHLYNVSDAVTWSNAESGGFTSSFDGYADGGGSPPTAVWRWSNGLGDALGFKMQFYGYSSATQDNAYHHTPLLRFTCNNVSATFAPKGQFRVDSTSGNGNNNKRAGNVMYPTIYDLTTNNSLTNTFGSGSNITGHSLPASFFVYY